MKKIYLLTLGVVASAASFAQSGLQFKSDANSKQYKVEEVPSSQNGVQVARGTETCTDVSRWAWGRSFQATGATYFGTILHNDPFVPNSYGTYVPVPLNQDVKVSGFQFYAGGLRPDGNTTTINAVIYSAGSDSLPTGPALASVSLNIDTVINGAFPAINAVFANPVTLTGPFILSVENSMNAGDSITILRGFTGSGVADDFPVVYQADSVANGDYFRMPGVLEFGGRLPHYYPTIEFTQNNDFAMDVNALTMPNQTVNFTHNAPLGANNPVLSISGFVGEVTSTWDFDDGTGEFNVGDTSHIFVNAEKDYQVLLTDSLFMWDGGVCVLTQTHLLEKAWPASINDVDSKKLKAFVMENNITVQNAEGLVTIYSITGAVVKKAYVSATSQNIDASDLKEGVYILTVNNQAIKFKL